MISGFYSSAAGMLGQIEQQDVISNNLANCNSAGYKRVRVGFSSFDVEMANAGRTLSSQGSGHAQCVIPVPYARQDWGQGELSNTSSATDLAIEGQGYFVVKTNNGQRLTRDGNFRLNDAHQLVTFGGDQALGKKGPITISGKDWQIDPNGNVRVNGTIVDTLRIQLPPDAPAGTRPGQVMQGRIESSNVNAIRETTGMITALRAYEAGQRAIQSIDQTLDKLINQAGRSA